MKKQAARMILGLAASLNLLILTGCEVDSSETGSRNVDINVWGIYYGTDTAGFNNSLVNNCSGSRPEYFDLRQYGDQLEAIDNHGIVFRGTIGSANSEAQTCSFTLEGKTTTGNRVIANGHITISGNSAIMEGSWIEDNLYAVLYGIGDAPAKPSLSLSPTTSTLSSNNTEVVLTVTGGTPPYKWAPSSTSYGNLSDTTGSTITYTATKFQVTNTVTVTDSASSPASRQCIITQN